MKNLLRDFAIGVAGSIAATILLLALSSFFGRSARDEGFLDVASFEESYGDIVLNRIEALNSSSYAYSPLTFRGEATGGVLFAGVTVNGRPVPAKQGTAVWAGTLGKGERLRAVIAVTRGSMVNDLHRQFEGTY